jgi:hypothetical protein
MPLADDLVALAALAGNTVVAAAATDAWETARRWVGRLFGRGGAKPAEMAQRRLEETRSQLVAVTAAELEHARTALAQQWAFRLADLLEEDPDAEAYMRAMIGQIQAEMTSAADHSAVAAHDMNVKADGGAAAGVMHAEAVAGQYGTAIGRMEYHRPQVASQPVSLTPRPVFLAGREQLLAELDSRLSAAEGSWPRIIALCGLGGCGKTSVAVEYAHRHLAQTGLAWQLIAEDHTVLAAEFGRLAGVLGAVDPLTPADPVAAVHAVLAAYPSPWLLVFDNAPDQESIRPFLPPAGTGQVLITSQNALWPPGQAVEVPVLDVEVAAEFLTGRTNDPDGQAARQLAAELGGLPLALEQAGAYIQATGITLAEYLDLFRERRADLLRRGRPSGHDLTVAATFALAFSRLEPDAPTAAELLRLLACLAPAPVPLRILSAAAGVLRALDADVASALLPLCDDQLVRGDAVASLRRYSLITLAGDGLVLVHRLVQAVTLDLMPDAVAAEWRQAGAVLIGAAIPAETGLPNAWATCAALLPHAQVALAQDSGAMARIANYLGVSGHQAAARDLCREIAEARKFGLGPEHPETLGAIASFASWTGEAGDPASARDLFAGLLPVKERVLGPEHPDTLDSRENLANWTGYAGNWAAARDLYAELLPVKERILGPEHPDTLVTRANLAYWTGYAGNRAAARDLYAALLPVRERVLGPEHPNTLATRHNLASWTGAAGDPAAARDLFVALLPVKERVLGPEHPDTLTARHELARFTGRAGEPAAARDLYAALLPIRERVSGAEHPITLTARRNLARFTGEAGEPAAARDLFAELVPVHVRVLGAEHPDTLAVRSELGAWIGRAGDPAAARDLFAELVPVHVRVLGVGHPDTLAVRSDLAAWTEQAADAK